MSTITVLGDGAWGTAIATVLAHNGHQVTLWCYDASVAQSIRTSCTNDQYLPGIILYRTIEPTTDFFYAFKESEAIFEAIPVPYLRTTLIKCKDFVTAHIPWVILSKGIEQDTLLLPTEIINTVVGPTDCAVVSGPSFARQLAQKQITACTLAGNSSVTGFIQSLLNNEYFTTELSSDFIGVQLAGAFKNCVALGIGLLEALGYGDNTKAFFLTRMLDELKTLIIYKNGQPDTITSLAGIGDILLTAYGSQSRNRAVGYELGKGVKLSALKESFGTLPEGINTLQSLYQLLNQQPIKLPLCALLYRMIFENASCNLIKDQLMAL